MVAIPRQPVLQGPTTLHLQSSLQQPTGSRSFLHLPLESQCLLLLRARQPQALYPHQPQLLGALILRQLQAQAVAMEEAVHQHFQTHLELGVEMMMMLRDTLRLHLSIISYSINTYVQICLPVLCRDNNSSIE